MELVSVIVPVYNRAEIFERSLRSIAEQTYRPLQIIVVDDGSTEDIKTPFTSIQKQYSSSNCSFTYHRQENSGAPVARNRGLRDAMGEYIIFWDADVMGNPDMIQSMVTVLNKNQISSFVYSNFYFGKKLMKGKKFSLRELQNVNFITTTSLIRKSAVIQWDESLKRFQDWDLWLTMAEQGKQGVWIDEALFHVELGGTISSWLPSFAYQAPYRWLPFFSKQVKKYEAARKVIITKHQK